MSKIPIRRDQNWNLIQDTYGEKAFQGEYDVSDNLIYSGFALPVSDTSASVWQVRKLVYIGTNLTEVLWPEIDGKASTDYSFAYDDRATFTYS